VVGGPYEYGVRGARHAVMNGKPTTTAGAPEPVEAIHH
jgi:hypothetical protein